MAVNFKAGVDSSVVSEKSLSILEEAANRSNNSVVTITSTLRTPIRQAEAMYANLIAGRNISYKAPGREVVSKYTIGVRSGWDKSRIIAEMVKSIEEQSREGKRVSLHCVPTDVYEQCNIIDVSTRIPNPRDFVKALMRNGNIQKVITPFYSEYNDARVVLDAHEPAIHVEINQN